MVPTYSMMGPFRGHMSLKSSSFSPGPSCKLSHQYIIQDHMASHYKKLMSAKAAVDSSAPKSMQTSVKCFYIPVSDLQTDVMTSTSGLTNSIFSPQSIDSVQITSDLAIGNFVCQSNRNSRKSSRSLLGIKQSCKSSILPPAVSWLQSFETSLLFQKSSGVKHQPTLLKHLVGTKPELPLQAKNEGMSQDKDQQKRDRLIQALEKYKKDLERGLPASPFNSRSVSPSRRKARRSLLENCHLYLTSGRNNCSRTKREQPPSVCFQQLTSRTLIPAPTARKPIRKTAQHALSQAPAHNSSTDRLSASPLLQSHMHLGSCNRKKMFQNSFNKIYSGDLLDKHSIYFTEKKQCFTPQILKTSHQSFLVKYRCYNPPSQKKSSSPGRSSLKSADINNEKKRKLHRFLEDAHVRPHSGHFSQQPVELGVPGLLQRTRMVPTVHTQIHELWIPDSEMPLSPGSQLEEKEEYLHFLQDLTNDILIRGCYDKEALEDIFQMHIKSKRYNLDEVKRRRIVQSLKSELNITSQPASSTSCKGTRSKDTSTPAPCF